MPKGYNIAARIAGLLLLLPLAAIFAVQLPGVQQKLCNYALDKLEKGLDGKVSFSEIKVMPTGALLLKDALILDSTPYTEDIHDRGWAPVDTLFYARSITASFTLKGLLSGEGLHLGRASVSDAQMTLVMEPSEKALTPGGTVTNLQRIFNMPVEEPVPAEPGPDIFDLRSVRVRNFRFAMLSFGPRVVPIGEHSIDFEDMDVVVEDLKANGLRFAGGKMYGNCTRLKAREKSGFSIDNLTGSCEVGLGKTLINDLHLLSGPSDIRLASLALYYKHVGSFSNFIEEVRLEGRLSHSTVAIESVAYFAPALYGNPIVAEAFGGYVSGYVNDLSVSGFSFTDLYSGVSGRAECRIIGLPDPLNFLLSAKVHEFHFNTRSVSDFVNSWAQGRGSLELGGLAPGREFTFTGSMEGPINKSAIEGTITSSIGSIRASLDLRNATDTARPIELRGTIGTSALDCGKMLGIDALGKADALLSANLRLEQKGIRATVDSLSVSSLEALGYTYSGIRAEGTWAPEGFSAELRSGDPSLQALLTATGGGSIAEGTATYKLSGDVTKADLRALNLDTRGGSSEVSFGLEAEASSTAGPGSIGGTAGITGLCLINDGGTYRLGDANAEFNSGHGGQSLAFHSSFADATYNGSRGIKEIWGDLQDATTRSRLANLYPTGSRTEDRESGTYAAEVKLHGSRELLAYVLPDLYIADGTVINSSLDGDGTFDTRITSPGIAFGSNYLKGASVCIDNLDGSLNAFITGTEFQSDLLTIRSPSFTAWAKDNSFALAAQFDNLQELDGTAEIYVNGELLRTREDSLVVRAHPLESYIRIENDTWRISESQLCFSGGSVSFDDFSLSCGEQSIRLDGGISGKDPATLSLSINNLNLKGIDTILGKNYGFEGLVNGSGYLSTPLSKGEGTMLSLKAEGIAIGGNRAGDFSITGNWDEATSSIGAILLNEMDGRTAISSSASYNPGNKALTATVDLDRMSPSLALPFLGGIFSGLGGGISGHIDIDGPTDRLNIRSSGLRLDEVKVSLGLTGVEYTVDGPLHVNDSGLFFDEVKVTDRLSGKGTINGSLKYDHFKDMKLDAGLDFRNLLMLDSGAASGQSYYGQVTAGGNAQISGPLDKLSLDADVRTGSEGIVHVALGSALTGATSDLLTFVQAEKPLDDYEKLMAEGKTKGKKLAGDFSAHARINVSSGLTAAVTLGGDSGSSLTAGGQGSAELFLRPAKNQLNINGNYTLSGGKFHFNAANLIDKDLDITQGSSLKFNGAIPDTELDITAAYNLKTQLSTLLADTTATATRRAVECLLNISGKLSSPEIGFEVNVPDLDPTTQAQVQAALNTEDKVQKQFVALLVMGSFIPDERSGVFNSNNVLYSSVSSIVSGQLNNILQKLDVPLDFGFNYQQNNSGKDVFDVAVSTQLFNNRVVVNGSIGNRQYSTGDKGDFAGDLDIDLKLDRQGQFRLKLFSHSADQYTTYLDNSQRNGVGLSWQKEYSNLRDLWRSVTRKQRQKETGESSRRNETDGIRTRETVTIKIEADE